MNDPRLKADLGKQFPHYSPLSFLSSTLKNARSPFQGNFRKLTLIWRCTNAMMAPASMYNFRNGRNVGSIREVDRFTRIVTKFSEAARGFLFCPSDKSIILPASAKSLTTAIWPGFSLKGKRKCLLIPVSPRYLLWL
jgi:hypothetical protein